MRRTVHRFRSLYLASFAALVGLSLAIACGTEVSIPEPPLTIKPVIEAGADTSVVTDTGAPDVESDAGVDAADVVCPDVVPNDAEGIYATPAGTNSATCGTRAAPCKTLSHSVTRAGAAFRTKVYAARGTYVEKLTLAAGIEVIGGWDVTGTTWKRTCVSPEEAVVVRAPAGQNVTVEARDLGGVATLSLVRVESKLAAQVNAGESLYGLVAVGTTTQLVMNTVRIEMADAAPGANGAKGDAGAPAPAVCNAGTGAAGVDGGQGAGAPVGSYDPTLGYSPGTAAAGGAASAGANGLAGGAATCVTCGTCAVNGLACDFTPAANQPTCGKDGTSGCGGGAGGPGAPASGGGSNIGVFVWDANVTINGGKVKSGDAGNGGTGGAGGVGAAGTKGAAGAATDLCTVGCTFDVVNVACIEVKARGDGGAAGDAGGAGGSGGAGGGGGGGSSFAIYQGGSGLVTTTGGVNLAHGKAGAGGTPAAGMGAAGVAANRIP